MRMKLSTVVLLLVCTTLTHAADRPNILWITCEDISPYLGCYGYKQARTPNLDKLASEGFRYTHAYSNAPVCAVARSTLLTGMYASTIGTEHMRCTTQLPEVIPAYPKLLRAAGYYCTNNVKKDYNSNYETDASLWDASSQKAHWKNRKPGQPFFAVYNILVTHESQLSPGAIKKYVAAGDIPKEPRVHPADVQLPPYHPDLPAIREDWARFDDLITLMDRIVGEQLRALDEAGVAEDTIVFFYSDHGGMLSRSKHYIYNTGEQVPLIIRVPEKWKRFAPGAPGSAIDRPVSFVDFAKTVLRLAGAEPPKVMQGSCFLGPDADPAPEYVHLYRDRMGERYDTSRAVTDGHFYFIRNFMPHRPLAYDSRYPYTVQTNWNALADAYEAGKCNAIQSRFFEPKATVEFYDTDRDPWQVNDLSHDAAGRQRMERMAAEVDRWMIDTHDTGLIPEAMWSQLIGPDKAHATIYEYAQSDAYPIERILAAAKSAGDGDRDKLGDYRAMMRDEHPVMRYWGAYGLFLVRTSDEQTQAALRDMMMHDAYAANRLMAAQALGRCGDAEAAFEAIKREATHATDGYVLLTALNAFQYSHTDDRLTQADWREYGKMIPKKSRDFDAHGYEYAGRMIDDALAIWPKRRPVD